MKGASILVVFFLMFTVASLLAPFPMFPGNFLVATIGARVRAIGSVISAYALYLSAAFNGLFYGVLVWLVFAGIGRKLVKES
jgi:hypothetical protein